MDAVKNNNTEITIIIDEDHRLVQQTQVSRGHVLARIFPPGALARSKCGRTRRTRTRPQIIPGRPSTDKMEDKGWSKRP